jgi:hypothetical protein
MNKIVLAEKDFISLISNDMVFNGIKFTDKNLPELITGEIIEIENNLIILQDIGSIRISNILDKYRKF